MFCFQCQETLKNTGCTLNGICGKKGETANLQDLLIYTAKGVALAALASGQVTKEAGHFLIKALFTTVTNVSFDNTRLISMIRAGLHLRDSFGKAAAGQDALIWTASDDTALHAKAASVGVLVSQNPDVRSLRELLVYGMKGIAAYSEHALVLGYEDPAIAHFLAEGLASTTRELGVEEMIGLVMKAGQVAVTAMALLDTANSESYGNPELTQVDIGVGKNPAILISGHDLKDMEELLKQTEGTGVDVYTHGEMLAANYYPAFKKYAHFHGNYGNAWWLQDKEFESFNGPILMTTNCLVPPKDSYKERIFTTGNVAFPGVRHVADRPQGGSKDFSALIALAKTCPPPTKIESGTISGGFAHAQVLALADKVIEAVRSGAIRKFVVMGGCDGRQNGRNYYTEFAKRMPKDTLILTAGCAKYRYNKLDLGEIDGIPRLLDAGQCNDSYSLVVIALKLKEVFGVSDINELPIVYNIAWYEQKAVAVLLALLYLGVRNIHLGPTLPAFLSPAVVDVLVEKFGISPIGLLDQDLAQLVG